VEAGPDACVRNLLREVRHVGPTVDDAGRGRARHGDRLNFNLPSVSRKKVTAAFDNGRLSSDSGVMLLALADRRRAVADTLAALIADHRDPAHITHTVRMSCAPACWRLAAAIPMATTSTGCDSIQRSRSPGPCPQGQASASPSRASWRDTLGTFGTIQERRVTDCFVIGQLTLTTSFLCGDGL
jgi:Transposase DDE domain group 1